MSYGAIISTLTPYITIIGSVIIGYIAWSVRKIFVEKITELDKKFEKFEKEIDDKINTVNTNLGSYKEEMLRHYVRKEDFDTNHEAHEKIWIELNALRERIARVEK